MVHQQILELENLIMGKIDSMEIKSLQAEVSRDHIIERINNILNSVFPGCWFEGEFINKDNTSYLIYDLHLCGANHNPDFTLIRLLDFGDKFRLIRV